MNVALYRKAVIACGLAGLGAIATGLADSTLTPLEYVVAAIAALTALGAVYAVPNRRKR